jgi:hypothetical protein
MNRKLIIIILIVAGLLAAIFVADLLVGDPEKEQSVSPYLVLRLRMDAVGCALARYRGAGPGFALPPQLDRLIEDGFLACAGSRASSACAGSRASSKLPDALRAPDGDTDAYFYEPCITADMPLDVAILWPKKPVNNIHLILRNDFRLSRVTNRKQRANEMDYKTFVHVQRAARRVLFAGEDGLAGRLMDLIRIKKRHPQFSLEVRCACYRLGKLPQGLGEDILADALKISHIRFDAARALTVKGDARGKGILMRALDNDDYHVRRQAFEALCLLGLQPSGYSPFMSADTRRKICNAPVRPR